MRSRRTLVAARRAALVAFALALAALATSATAQPFGSWTLYSRSDPGDYFEIPHSPALNPSAEITIEGWVDVDDGGGCSNIIGKDWQTGWWVGICGNQLRSYLRGLTGGSSWTAGDIGEAGWHHFAVTYDGAQWCHYIDGRPPQCRAASGSLASNGAPVRIGSDVSYASFAPNGAINELRLWNVARSTAQIRANINVPLISARPGLVAVWANGAATDVVGPHDGVMVGSVGALTFPAVGPGCVSTATVLCVHDRFQVRIFWETDSDSGQATRTNPSTFQSGIFWFFNSTNWEVMVKVLNGCVPVLGNRWWVFSAATTNVFYRMEVYDQVGSKQKIYFNYAGPPAPAVTDVNAFDTCP